MLVVIPGNIAEFLLVQVEYIHMGNGYSHTDTQPSVDSYTGLLSATAATKPNTTSYGPLEVAEPNAMVMVVEART